MFTMKLPVMGTCISFSLTFFIIIILFTLGLCLSFDFGRKCFLSHDISIVIRCALLPPLSAPSPQDKKTASKGLKIYIHFVLIRLLWSMRSRDSVPPLPYLCDKRCSVVSLAAPPCVCVCVCTCVCLRGRLTACGQHPRRFYQLTCQIVPSFCDFLK